MLLIKDGERGRHGPPKNRAQDKGAEEGIQEHKRRDLSGSSLSFSGTRCRQRHGWQQEDRRGLPVAVASELLVQLGQQEVQAQQGLQGLQGLQAVQGPRGQQGAVQEQQQGHEALQGLERQQAQVQAQERGQEQKEMSAAEAEKRKRRKRSHASGRTTGVLGGAC